MTDLVGTKVTHKRYLPYSHAHYAGALVDGAFSVAMFGDVATELCIVTDQDEGLFVGYSNVEFLAPVYAGDFLEITATLVREGRRSREMEFESRVVARAAARVDGVESKRDSHSVVLSEPVVAVRARGTVVVPEARS